VPQALIVVKLRIAPLLMGTMGIFELIRSVMGVVQDLAADVPRLFYSSIRPRTALIAENLFLRKQLAFYEERQIRPRRLTNTARLWLVFWSCFFAWRSALLVVKPATLIGWHRKAFRLFWKWKSRPGRHRIPPELRKLIAQMVRENPTWGEERIAHELCG
jgi:putative transposase